MPSPDPRMADVRDGIAVITAWLAMEDDPDEELLNPTVARIVNDHDPDEPAVGLAHVVKGLVGFCAFLLARREKETGIRMQETLQEYGRDLADE